MLGDHVSLYITKCALVNTLEETWCCKLVGCRQRGTVCGRERGKSEKAEKTEIRKGCERNTGTKGIKECKKMVRIEIRRTLSVEFQQFVLVD